MANRFERHALELQRRVADEGIDLLLLTDPDSVYYVSGYWGFLGVDWGRPTVIAVPADGGLTLITPKLESEMAAAMTWIEDIRTYVDGEAGEWADPLRDLLSRQDRSRIAVERLQVPAMVSEFLRDELGPAPLVDGSDCLGEMRMIKSPEEIETLRQASKLAVAICAAGKTAIAEGVPEYEVALAVAAAGTRKAADWMVSDGADVFQSPMIHILTRVSDWTAKRQNALCHGVGKRTTRDVDISLLRRTGSALEDPHGAFAGTNFRPEVAYDHRSIRNLSFGRQLEEDRDGPAVQRGTHHARGV